MKRVLSLSACLVASSVGLATANSSANAFSDAQKKEIQTMIHDYLVNQPEVLIEASQALQARQQKMMEAQIQSAVKQHAQAIFQGTQTTVGQAKAPVTMVEFFDYQCGHCKKMGPVVDEVMKNHGQLRVIFKEFPIFGEQSVVLSKIALAAAKQNKYLPLHQAFLSAQGSLNQEKALAIAKKNGLNIEQLKKDMESSAIKQELDKNRQLAESLHLMGTPAFIIASTPEGQFKDDQKHPIAFVPGAASSAQLTEMIKNASQS